MRLAASRHLRHTTGPVTARLARHPRPLQIRLRAAPTAPNPPPLVHPVSNLAPTPIPQPHPWVPEVAGSPSVGERRGQPPPVAFQSSVKSDRALPFARDASRGQYALGGHPAAGQVEYGRWQWLSHDSARMMRESSPSSGFHHRRLIGRTAGATDLALWACLLNFCHRTDYRPGISFLLGELFKRRRLLYTKDDALSDNFWATVLDLSLRDEQLLEQLWVYAEWMREAHGVKLPGLYHSVVRFLLAEATPEKTVQWHVRLMANFGPDRLEFARILMGAIDNVDPDVQRLLKSLYATSPHHELYDVLVPYLWGRGHSTIARSWRDTMISHNDVPRSTDARSFIRYLAAYFPQKPLAKEEIEAGGLQREMSANDFDGDLRVLVNCVHGKTFGIEEKPYNDMLGAKWFASSWVSLDTAIHFVHALGVRKIGPLSLQSIALRERTLDGLARRLEQLDSLEIDIGKSQYAKAVRHLTLHKDQDTLQELLGSDIHPDVYDDLDAQKDILRACTVSGDWKTYRLILSVRSAEGLDHIAVGFNDLLLMCLGRGKGRMVLAILAEMRSRGIPVLPTTSDAISQHIIDNAHKTNDMTDTHTDFLIALGRRMMETPYPLLSTAWKPLLRSLGHRYKFDELEQLSMEIVAYYRSADASGTASMNIPTADVPDRYLHQHCKPRPFQSLPRDLPLVNDRHPIQSIFDNTFQKEIIRRTLRFALLFPQSTSADDNGARQVDFSIARGVKLLAELKRVGVNVPDLTVRKAVVRCLVDLYGYDWVPRKRHMAVARSRNRLSLQDARDLINSAWGVELLPPSEELTEQIDKEAFRRKARTEPKLQYLAARIAGERKLPKSSQIQSIYYTQ